MLLGDDEKLRMLQTLGLYAKEGQHEWTFFMLETWGKEFCSKRFWEDGKRSEFDEQL